MSSKSRNLSVVVAGQQSGWAAPASVLVPFADETLSVSRFVNADPATRELQFETSADHYRISITLRGSRVLAHYNGRQAFDGKTAPGMVHIAEPSTRLSAAIQSPGEALHLFLPIRLLTELREGMKRPTLVLRKTIFEVDSSIAFLAQAIADTLQNSDETDQLLMDGLSTAVVAKLISRFSNAERPAPAVSDGLSAWRLKKVREFVDAHLENQISLKTLAETAGLSQMHFAAQFRQACGLTPHEYLLQQRIARAKDLLVNTQLSVLEIALAVGFGTHAHFSNTFRRYTGASPASWRKLR